MIINSGLSYINSPGNPFKQVSSGKSTEKQSSGSVSNVSSDDASAVATVDLSQRSQQVQSENVSASNTRIQDSQKAMELVDMTQAQMIAQNSTALLAQANASKQSILQLLSQ